MGDEKIIADIEGALNVYHSSANRLRTLLFFLGIISIVCSLLVASFADAFEIIMIKILSFTSVLSLTILTSFNISKKGNDFRLAWRLLNNAYLLHQVNKLTIEDLIKTKEEAEKILGLTDITINSTKSSA